MSKRLTATALALGLAGLASTNVNLVLRPLQSRYSLGDTVQIDLVAMSDLATETIGALDVVLQWDTAFLNPVSSNNSRTRDANGPYSWFASGFINPSPLNNSLADGDAVWTGLGQFLVPFVATSQGNVLTTLRFVAKKANHVGRPTFVAIPPALGGTATAVFSGDRPNWDITGTLTGTPVTISFGKIGPHQ